MKKHGAIELSANALVIIIISIVILGFSIVLVRNMLNQSNLTVDQLDAKTQQQIESLLVDPAARVALPVKEREVSRGETARFGLGVKNVIGESSPFYSTLEFDQAYDKQNNQIYCADCNTQVWKKMLDFGQAVTIENTQEHLYLISITVPKTAASGTYAYNLKVCYNDGTDANNQLVLCDSTTYPDYYIDGGMKKIYVIVK